MPDAKEMDFLNDPLKLAGAVAGGAFLLSPLGLPVLRNVSRLAVAGLGVYAAASMAGKAADTVMHFISSDNKESDDLPFERPVFTDLDNIQTIQR